MVIDDGSVSCVTGSTAIDALRLALGSTLGAFIALAVVVAFVLLAKCQHRRRLRRIRRRRRRYSDKSQPLTDSDNVSFFDDYEYNDDDYGSVFDDNGRNDVVAAAAMTEFSLQSSPTRFLPPTRSDEFTVTDDGDVAGRKWHVGDTSAQFYDVRRDRELAADTEHPWAKTDSIQCSRISARTNTQSAFDPSVGCPAVFVSGVVDDNEESQGFPLAPSSMSASHYF